MGSWGIGENASEKEKLKADFNDMLAGWYSTATIDWECYSKLYDVCMPILDECYERMEKERMKYDDDLDDEIE